MAGHHDGDGGSNTNRRPPCASCKHQRRKCMKDCVLYAYFPAEKAEEYIAVHRIFGFNNMIKILNNLESESDRREAIDSLEWEASMWSLHPSSGPYGEFRKLQQQVKQLQERCEILETQLNPPRVSLSEPISMGKTQALAVNNNGAPTEPNHNVSSNIVAPTLSNYSGYCNGSLPLPLPCNVAPTINNNWAPTVPNNGYYGVLSVPNNGYNGIQSLVNNGNNGALGVPINNWHSSYSSNGNDNLGSNSYVNNVNGPFGQEKVGINDLERLLQSNSLLPYMPRQQNQRQRGFALHANSSYSAMDQSSLVRNSALYNSNYSKEIKGQSGFESSVESSYSNNGYRQEQRGRGGQAQQKPWGGNTRS
ncbi:hypothetical protein L6164_036766 [Bauhinia variegata]|uniref:Uncharacterized protein n=1 Tax=Bauhinia variegata TaxID=167791 RepID=A0ACB9KI84_BAUVA|nr:hypothetical protein L6164_036766 [Bauhinia variegata]